MLKNDEEKIFLIVNLAYFGDVLLTSPLVSNIKNCFPHSKIVFMTNKPFMDAAKYQRYVDEVIYINKNGSEKGLIGLVKYANNSPYKNKIYASFVVYSNDRGIILSKLLNAKNIISGSKFPSRLLLDYACPDTENIYVPDINTNFLKTFTGKEPYRLPMRYDPPADETQLVKTIKEKYKGCDIIAICTVSKNAQKDMPASVAAEIINILSAENKTVFYFGQGQGAKDNVEAVKELVGDKFTDLVNSTSLIELSQLLKYSKALISVDTGTLHMGCAVGTPVLATFYGLHNPEIWMPKEDLYKAKILLQDYNAESICSNLSKLIENKETV